MEKVSLVKVGGVCAILAAVSFIAAIVVQFVTGDIGPGDLARNPRQSLLDVDRDRTAFLTFEWFFLLASVLLIPAALGFYQALYQAGTTLWIAVAAVFTGALLLIAASMTLIGIAYELIPDYVEADETTKPALAAMASTIAITSLVAIRIGYLLSLGIGVGLFAVASLRMSGLPKWIGWLGLAAALLGGLLRALAPVSEVFGNIGFLGFLAFLVWMVVMGVAMLRLREPATMTPPP